jgi:hypothetical protein
VFYDVALGLGKHVTIAFACPPRAILHAFFASCSDNSRATAVDEASLVLPQRWLIPNDEKQRQLRPDVHTKSSGLYDIRPGTTVHVDTKQYCSGAEVPQILATRIPALLNEIIVPAKQEGEAFFCEGTPPRVTAKESVEVG